MDAVQEEAYLRKALERATAVLPLRPGLRKEWVAIIRKLAAELYRLGVRAP